jgi:hypothetical protein
MRYIRDVFSIIVFRRSNISNDIETTVFNAAKERLRCQDAYNSLRRKDVLNQKENERKRVHSTVICCSSNNGNATCGVRLQNDSLLCANLLF